MLAVVAACALILYRHTENMKRIHLGTESVFRWSKR
jgi:glycerol-3-phosphate acyltransferase PlsY